MTYRATGLTCILLSVVVCALILPSCGGDSGGDQITNGGGGGGGGDGRTMTWSWINPSPTGEKLLEVCMVDADVGYAGGEKGTIFRTDDGWATWTPMTAPYGAYPIYITFFDAQNGVVIDGNGNVYRTSNGASSWSNVGSVPSSPSLWSASFPTSNVGTIVAQAAIYRTTNSGITWVKQLSSGGKDVDFATEQIGVVVATDGSVLWTTNGGDTWTSRNAGEGGLYAVSCVDALIATAVGYDGGSQSQELILRTENGGSNWTRQSSGTSDGLRDVSFVDANVGVAVGLDGKIIRTGNGGNTWTRQTSDAFPRDLYAVHCRTTNHAVAVGQNGALTVNTGGASWSLGTQDLAPEFFDLKDVVFVDQDVGIIVGRKSSSGVILRSVDGGDHWSEVAAPAHDYLYAVHFPDDDHGYAVGADGMILFSSNKGASWQTRNSGSSEDLYGVNFTDANNGVAVGGNGTILLTSNGGSSWADSSITQNTYLFDVSFFDGLTGIIAGYDGMILRTTDGGFNWTQRTSGTTGDFYCVATTGAQTAFVIGQSPLVKTTDAGFTWKV